MLGLLLRGPLGLLFPFWLFLSLSERRTTERAKWDCVFDAECTHLGTECSAGVCTAHTCVQRIFSAGPSPNQQAGDCARTLCDGTSPSGTQAYDASDLPASTSDCVVPSCGANGPQSANADDGTACGARKAGVCLTGECVTCTPKNPRTCGGEGPNEPRNDSGATPSPLVQHRSFCAYSSAEDVDWYSFQADDSAWTYDALRFHAWSTAKTIELCVYARCWNGRSPEGSGSCTPLLPGPNGSEGCCWTGAPSEVTPDWDLDCPGTSEDSGTVYVSVRTPNASACEVYALNGGY